MAVFFCNCFQMMSNVDGHSWALCAIDDERPPKIFTPLNKEQIPVTDSPVVVQQHNIPSQKFVLLSAKVKSAFSAHNHMLRVFAPKLFLPCREVTSFKNCVRSISCATSWSAVLEEKVRRSSASSSCTGYCFKIPILLVFSFKPILLSIYVHLNPFVFRRSRPVPQHSS